MDRVMMAMAIAPEAIKDKAKVFNRYTKTQFQAIRKKRFVRAPFFFLLGSALSNKYHDMRNTKKDLQD